MVSEWQASNCSVTCGGGLRAERRHVMVPSHGAGRACPMLVRAAVCNTQPCAMVNGELEEGCGVVLVS